MDSILEYINSLFKQGFNVIPVNSMKKPLVTWKEWQNKAIPEKVFQKWKTDGLFNTGFAIITGRFWRGPYEGKYLVCIDIDNKKGIEEFLSNVIKIKSLDDLAQYTVVVQHDDAKAEKAHIYLITSYPIVKKCGIAGNSVVKANELGNPALEVKADSSTYVIGPYSMHKNGHIYQIIGTSSFKVLDNDGTKKLERALDNIYHQYRLENELNTDSSSLPNIGEMDKEDYVVYEGNNRHLNLLRKCDSWYAKSNKTLIFDELIIRANNWNSIHCVPPIGENEVSDLVKQSMAFIDDNNKNSEGVKVGSDTRTSLVKNQSDNDNQVINPDNLVNKISSNNFIEYIVKVAKKTIKMEDNLVRLILYTSLSTYTKNPVNLGIMAPTSEGKTYAVSEVIKYLPKKDVLMIGSMSPKVIIRDNGVLVDSNYEPIEDKIRALKKILRNEKDIDKKQETIDKIESLYDNSKVIIDLSNKILVFLEPPHSETWDILKPILSHDSYEIEHPYVYKTDNKGLEVKHIVTRGWPACIFCSAKDDSSWSMWPEIQSRFFITSPNMIRKKYEESNKLIVQKKGMPLLVQQQLIVSSDEIQNAKDCILLLKHTIQKNSDNNVWIPYSSILSSSLPSEKGPDVRIAERIFSLLNLVAQINSFNRFRLLIGNENLCIASIVDLDEVLRITHNITGIPSYKLEFFTDIFLPLFKLKHNPDTSAKDDTQEERIALSTTEMAQFYKDKKGKSLTTDNIKKTYLDELKNNGLIDDIDSKVDKRRKIYYPIVDIANFKINQNYTNLDESNNNLHFFRLKLSKYYNKIDKDWLKMEILDLIKYGIGQTNMFKLLNQDGNELCICQFIQKYNSSGSLIRYFQYDENCIYHSKVFGKMIKID